MKQCVGCAAPIPDVNDSCPSCGQLVPSYQLPTEHEEAAVAVLAPSPALSPEHAPSPQQPRFVPGVVLDGRFRIVALAGRGGMGEVYRADDLKLEQTVALKFLPASLSSYPEALAQLRREVRLARQVSHPNVCRVFDIGESGGLAFLSMEYVDGEDLASLLRRIDRVPQHKAIEIARQLCAGLAAAHEHGVLHRDLKPANVMLDGKGKVRITDFGLAGLAMAPADGNLAGTPAYMAPEQLAGAECSIATDIYAVGLILYEIFTGKRAFPAVSVEEVRRLHLHSAPSSPSSHVKDIDATVERVILRCLEKQPSLRPQSALQVAAALPGGDPLAAGETPSPWLAFAANPKPRIARNYLFAALALVVIAVLLAGLLFSRRGHALTEKDWILVTDFVNDTEDTTFDGTLKKALAVDLGQSPFLNVFPEPRVEQTLRLMGRSPDERITSEIGREICHRKAIKVMLSSSIAAVGRQYLITLIAVNVATGDTLVEVQEQADSKDHVLNALHTSISKLRKRLGESLASVEKFEKPLEEATTSSLEALKAYTMGEEQHREENELAAIPLFQRAVELDSNFALAYARLGTAYNNIGEMGKAEQYRRKAFDLRKRASERERLYIEAHYYLDSGAEDKGIASYEIYAHIYPRDAIPLNNLGVLYEERGQYEKALEYDRRALDVDPDSFNAYEGAVSCYLALGQAGKAKAVLQAALERQLGGPGAHSTAVLIALAQEDTVTAQREMAVARKDSREDRFLTWVLDSGFAAQHGKWKQARLLTRRAADMSRRVNLHGEAAVWLVLRAFQQGEFGLKAEAGQGTSAALSLSRGPDVVPTAAATLALNGQEREAQALLSELAQRRPQDQWIQVVDFPWLNAIIAINHREPAKAIELLQQTLPYQPSVMTLGLVYTRGSAYLVAGHPLEAARQFQSILDIKMRIVSSPFMALAELGLARAYAAMGEKDKACAAYQHVLSSWKDADRGVPLIEQARGEYAKLTSQ